jgi:formyl-CoA transferase
LRKRHPRLICCSISGYGESGPFAARKAYDLLVQAEVGLASVTGGPDAPARVGFSVADIGAGMNAYQAILEALIARSRSGEGATIAVSLFDAMAEWMTVPLLSHEAGHPFRRIGLAHAAIAPYGVFQSRDGADILISIQNDREWRVLAGKVLADPPLADDPRFATNRARVTNRAATDALIGAAFARHDVGPLMTMLEQADIAFARVNDCALLSAHPHLRRITVDTPSGPAAMPAPAPVFAEKRSYGRVPALGEHSEKIRAEFLPR